MRLEGAAEMMCPAARFHRHQASRHSNPAILQLFLPRSIPNTAICISQLPFALVVLQPKLRDIGAGDLISAIGLGRTAHEIPRRREPEIVRLFEQSPLPVRHTLAKLGIPRATFLWIGADE